MDATQESLLFQRYFFIHFMPKHLINAINLYPSQSFPISPLYGNFVFFEELSGLILNLGQVGEDNLGFSS